MHRHHLEELRLATELLEGELRSKQQLIEKSTADESLETKQCPVDFQTTTGDQFSLLDCNIESVSRSSTPISNKFQSADQSARDTLLAGNVVMTVNNSCLKQFSNQAVQTSFDVSWREEGIQTECLANHCEIQTSGEWHNLLDEKQQLEREKYLIHC